MKKGLLLLAIFTAGLVLAVAGCGGGYGGDNNKPAGTGGTTTGGGYSRY